MILVRLTMVAIHDLSRIGLCVLSLLKHEECTPFSFSIIHCDSLSFSIIHEIHRLASSLYRK